MILQKFGCSASHFSWFACFSSRFCANCPTKGTKDAVFRAALRKTFVGMLRGDVTWVCCVALRCDNRSAGAQKKQLGSCYFAGEMMRSTVDNEAKYC